MRIVGRHNGRRDPRRTPAEPHERVVGSAVNRPGSAARSAEGDRIRLSATLERAIETMVREHNARMSRPSQRAAYVQDNDLLPSGHPRAS